MLCLPNLFVSQIFWPLFSFPAFWAGQIPCKETDILADSTSPDAQVDLPAEDQGIRAVFWSDPCFSSKWITCVPWIPRVKSEGGPELAITEPCRPYLYRWFFSCGCRWLGLDRFAVFTFTCCVLSSSRQPLISVSSSTW